MNRSLKIICLCFFICSIWVGLSGCKSSFLSDLYPDTISDYSQSSTEAGLEERSSATEESKDSDFIYIHVCGCVKKPGLYCLKEGSRIDAAIRAAGGFNKDADEKSVNLAEILVDGSQIEVKSQEGTSPDDSSASRGGSDYININEADSKTLMTLSGIGEERANAIVSYREKNGPFSSVEDIRNVEGIGDGIYKKIKNSIIVK